MTAASCAAVALLLLGGCRNPRQGPCDEPIEPTSGEWTIDEWRPARYVHLVTFEMGPILESLEGYMIVGDNSLRLYGMTESGQRAFDVAWIGSEKRVVPIYRAPFLKDDRVLDQIARATARIFLLRPRQLALSEAVIDEIYDSDPPGEARIFRGGLNHHVRWLKGDGFEACFMDWQLVGTAAPPFWAPTRIHYHGSAGPFFSFDLTLKLVRAEALEKRPPDALFDPPKK